jgi:glucokinase
MHEPLAIGIDFGGTTIKPSVVAGPAILERGVTLETAQFASATATVDALNREITRLRALHPGIAAIGVGMPGLVDPRLGIVAGLTNVPGWDAFPLRDRLQAAHALPVAIDNDAKAMTFAEWKYGAAQGQQNVICVTLGTGVGGGLILNGQLYRGAHNGAGEIGQTSIDMHGISGHYGNLGALEKYVGNQQITERAAQLYREAGIPRASDDCTPRALSEAACNGDPIAQALWNEVGTQIGAAFANLVWLLNPDCIVIGGGVAKAGKLLFDPIRTAIRTRTAPAYTEQLQIVPAHFSNDAGIIGAAALGLAFIDEPRK